MDDTPIYVYIGMFSDYVVSGKGKKEPARCNAADRFLYGYPVLLHDLNEHRLFVLGRSCLDNSADRLCDTALLADDLAHVVGIDAQLYDDAFLSFGLTDIDGLGLLDEGLSNILDQFDHDYRTPPFFSRPRTVSVG